MKRFAVSLFIMLGALNGFAEEMLKNAEFKKGLDDWLLRIGREYRGKLETPVIKKGNKGEPRFCRSSPCSIISPGSHSSRCPSRS